MTGAACVQIRALPKLHPDFNPSRTTNKPRRSLTNLEKSCNCPRAAAPINWWHMAFAVLALLALPMLAAVLGFAFYNRLITLRNAYKNAFAQIDVQLKRRHDLIPNIVETAKGYLQHEHGTLEEVTAARGAAVSATKPPPPLRAKSRP